MRLIIIKTLKNANNPARRLNLMHADYLYESCELNGAREHYLSPLKGDLPKKPNLQEFSLTTEEEISFSKILNKYWDSIKFMCNIHNKCYCFHQFFLNSNLRTHSKN